LRQYLWYYIQEASPISWDYALNVIRIKVTSAKRIRGTWFSVKFL
jgi:hypothetical protein